MADVVVAGSGPAGWAAAHHCARLGLDVTLVAPSPTARWPATYGLWHDECALLPAGSRWIEAPITRAIALTSHTLPRGYAILDNDSVRAALTHPGIRTVADTVDEVRAGPRGCSVTLRSGRLLAATVVINATGPGRAPGAEQTAFGVVVPDGSEEAVFMDWRPAPGFDRSTFRYAVPLPGGRTLLEETSLARRPGLGFAELRARLAARGIPEVGQVERVRIPLELPIPARRPGVIPFGVAAGLVHPATGYSVADAFRLAPRLAEALAGMGPEAAVRAGWRVLWPREARVVHGLRRRGLAVLLGLTPEQVPEFFEAFFGISEELQRKYLSERADVAGTAEAMLAIFLAADRSLRRSIVRFALIV
jgi:lycopene beta-cyclase